MKKILLVLAIVGMFVIAMTPAKNLPSDKRQEINYLQLAKNLLQNWDEKLATEGANSEEINETVQKMELYKQILKDEVKNMEKLGNVNLQGIMDRVAMIMELDSRIEWNNYLWEEHIKAVKEYEEYKEGKIELKFNTEIPNTLSTVYPTGGWKKAKRTSGVGGIYRADYNVNQRKGYAFSHSDNYNSGYGESSLYYEAWQRGNVPKFKADT